MGANMNDPAYTLDEIEALLQRNARQPIRLLVTGGRDFSDRQFMVDHLDRIHAAGPVVELIHGAARGADTMAARWAAAMRIKLNPFPAQWERTDVPGARIRYNRLGAYNANAGSERNARMLDQSCPTHAVVFPGGYGTEDMVQRIAVARHYGRALELIDLRFLPRTRTAA